MPIFELQDRDGKRYQLDAPDADQALAAFKSVQGGGKGIEKSAADIRKQHLDEAPLFTMEGGRPGGRALVNIGAGMQNVVDAAKQIFNSGPDDAAVRDRRMRDRELADATTGGSALQVAGEIAPTLAIPGGAIARGVGMAGRGLTSLAAESGIVGAAGGALQPTTSDESRTFNSLFGGALGAALPGLLAAAKGGVGMLTQWGAKDRASAQILKELGGPENAAKVLAQIQAHAEPAATSRIPLTPAEIAQNPALGMMERASAARDTAGWAQNVRLPQAQARDAALRDITSAADELPQRLAAREAAAGPLYEKAFNEGTPASTLAGRPAYDTATAQAVKMLANEGKVGGTTSAARGAEIEHYKKMALDDMIESANRRGDKNEARVLMGVRDKLLAELEAAAPSYQAAREGYAALSRPIDAAEGAAGVRAAIDKAPPVTFAAGDGSLQSVPGMTGKRLSDAVKAGDKGKFGPMLDDETRAGLDALKANLDRTEGLQRLLKNTGTSGGGSNTAMDTSALAQAAQKTLAGKLPLVGKFFEHADDMTRAALADFLQNPQRFTAAVSKKLEQRRPLSRSDEAILALARSASAATPELLLAQ